jgi:hypothetical protein
MPETPPPNPISPETEANLRALTTWQGDKTALWQSALDAAPARATNPTHRRWLRIGLTTAAAAALIVISVGMMLPIFGRVGSLRSVGNINFESGFAPPAPPMAAVPRTDFIENFEHRLDGVRPSGDMADARGVPLSSAIFSSDHPDSRQLEADQSTRQVIRKATIELIVPNTREAFAKCQHLLRADLSEFIEGSSLTGQDSNARAQLTLRVATSGNRLDEVLSALRALGKVDNENATGDDVTTQAVDLDASLRNERAVETEILKLLESRKDAKLADVIELRDKLAQIRLGIERLQGRRDSLARQVALASILVILRAEDAPKPEAPKPASILDSFIKDVSSAWTSGLETLTATIAFLIRILVGGLVWWLLLILAIAIARRVIRRLIPDPAAVPH